MFDDFIEEDDEDIDSLFEQNEEKGETYTPAAPLLPPRENPSVIGHETHEAMLLSLYSQATLPHALIFSGPAGIGKSTMAFRLARFLLKHGAHDGDAGQDGLFGDAPASPPPPVNMEVPVDDPVFRKVVSGGHPDLLYIERPLDEKKSTRKASVDIDSVRKIAPFLRMTSASGGWRIVIVDDCETMTRNAQNAILKILEEPPEKALLILVCHRLGAMIPTIRSRCRTLHFHTLPEGDFKSIVTKGAPGLSAAELTLLSDLSNGSPGRALSLQEDGGYEVLGKILTLLGTWPKWDWPLIHQTAENLSRPDVEAQYRAFAALMEWACQSAVLVKAGARKSLPSSLDTPAIIALLNHYSLEQWIEICEKLREHFIAIDTGNLDKRQGVLGAFTLMGA